MVSLADVTQVNDAIKWLCFAPCFTRVSSTSKHGEADCIPLAFFWRPGAAIGVTEIAERLLHMLLWNFAFMAGRGAMPAPSSAQRQPRRVRPIAVLQFLYRHEIRAGQRLCS